MDSLPAMSSSNLYYWFPQETSVLNFGQLLRVGPI